mmetsp:Transcript_4212/g.9779  ORF Transcript_4212/g.9779 Transcript_4212/m.9779 type:complete len:361 (-) Transcript_4212:560-1642(-)
MCLSPYWSASSMSRSVAVVGMRAMQGRSRSCAFKCHAKNDHALCSLNCGSSMSCWPLHVACCCCLQVWPRSQQSCKHGLPNPALSARGLFNLLLHGIVQPQPRTIVAPSKDQGFPEWNKRQQETKVLLQMTAWIPLWQIVASGWRRWHTWAAMIVEAPSLNLGLPPAAPTTASACPLERIVQQTCKTSCAVRASSGVLLKQRKGQMKTPSTSGLACCSRQSPGACLLWPRLCFLACLQSPATCHLTSLRTAPPILLPLIRIWDPMPTLSASSFTSLAFSWTMKKTKWSASSTWPCSAAIVTCWLASSLGAIPLEAPTLRGPGAHKTLMASPPCCASRHSPGHTGSCWSWRWPTCTPGPAS